MLLRLSLLALLAGLCLPARADVRYNLLTWPKYRLRGVNVNLDQSPPTRADLEHLAKVWKANHVRLQIFYGGVPEGAG
ncbi:MAG: hypothetical protein IT210_22910, partial [Armatimonadetes bacterium]|nr:hypothetical protein [Armatimonadota bacterium]